MSQSDYRTAAVTMLTECAADAGVEMQVYRGRPRSLYPPTGFVDAMHDELTDYAGSTIFQHTPTVDVVCVWGMYDSGEAADQRDAFVDSFHLWVSEHYHQAGGRSLIRPRRVDDVPNFVPDWLPPEQQVSYYATQITLEGFNTD